MALTLGNFVGFETGGLEEASATANTPLSVTAATKAPRSGTYCLQCGSSDQYDIAAFEAGASAGDDLVVGFAFQVNDVTPSSNLNLFAALNGSGAIFFIQLLASGELRVTDDSSNTYDSSGLSLSNDTWHYVEIRWQEVASGNFDLYVDDSTEITSTTFDGSDVGGAVTLYRLQHAGPAGVTNYFDDFYCYSGAAGVSDFLGTGAEVLGAYGNTVEDATDAGTTLDDGTWALVSEIGFNEGASNDAQYNGAGAQSGYCRADNADSNTLYGPLAEITGTSKGGKWIGRFKRGGGSGTTWDIVLGMYNGASDSTTTSSITLTAAYATFTAISESATYVPQDSADYFLNGFQKSAGGREIFCGDSISCLLHVAPTGGIEQLAASPAGVSNWSATLAVTKALSAAPAGVSNWSAALGRVRSLAASPAGVSSWSAQVAMTMALAASPASVSAWAAAMVRQRLISAAPVGTSLWTAAMAATRLMSAAPAGTSLWTAQLAATMSLVANPAGQSTLTAAMAVTRLISAAPAGVSLWTAQMAATKALAANPAGVSAWTAAMVRQRLMSAAPAGVSLWAAQLSMTMSLAAAPAGVSLWSATMVVDTAGGLVLMSATPAGVSAWTAQLSVTKALAAAPAGVSLWSAQLAVTMGLAASPAAVSAWTAAMVRQRLISAAPVSTSSWAAQVAVTKALAASPSSVSSWNAVMVRQRLMSALPAGVSSWSAILFVVPPPNFILMSAAPSSVSMWTATLFVQGQVYGVIKSYDQVEGTLDPGTALEGTLEALVQNDDSFVSEVLP